MHPKCVALTLMTLTAAACGKPNSGVVNGAADSHCAGKSPVVVGACPTSAAGAAADYGATMFGSEGNDDDCKYHIKWLADDVQRDKDVNFTVVVTALADGKYVTGAKIKPTDVLLTDTHPAPNTSLTVKESPPGTYVTGPVRFDAKGQWTVRFHLFEECADATTSPHGHAAFFVNVP